LRLELKRKGEMQAFSLINEVQVYQLKTKNIKEIKSDIEKINYAFNNADMLVKLSYQLKDRQEQLRPLLEKNCY